VITIGPVLSTGTGNETADGWTLAGKIAGKRR